MGIFNQDPKSEIWIQDQYPSTPAELPTFMLPRASLGEIGHAKTTQKDTWLSHVEPFSPNGQ
jgi:hypothetical protein